MPLPDGNSALHGPAPLADFWDARIAFYGQKPQSFLSFADNERFLELLRAAEDRAKKAKGEVKVRVYNFGGNPLLVKLVDRKKGPAHKVAEGVDFVVELRGQMPHDFVPGAFIALQRGAYMSDLDGNAITLEKLGAMVEQPMARYKYVVGVSKHATDLLLSYL